MPQLLPPVLSLLVPSLVPAFAAPAAPAVEFATVTPNLVVDDVTKSLAFYRDVLGFTVKESVPPAAPYVFVWIERGPVQVFLNDRKAVEHEMPAVASVPRGGAGLFFVITGVDALYEQVRAKAKVIMDLKDQFYGMREFAILDPDGYVLTFAQRI